MKFRKFIIPVSISLAAFIYGYRGEIWLGKVDPNAEAVKVPTLETPANNNNITKTPQVGPSSASRSTPTSSSALSAPSGGSPIKARELPLSSPEDTEEYAPEDESNSGDEEVDDVGEDPEADQADDQALPEDEPGADNAENEEVDSDANEGDLEGDETADTADKPVKP